MEGSPWALARRASLLMMLALVACGNAQQTARLANATSSSTAVGLPTWSALPSPWLPSLSPTIAPTPTPTPAPTHAPPTSSPTAAPGTATPSPTSSGSGGGCPPAGAFPTLNWSGINWSVNNGGNHTNSEQQWYLPRNVRTGTSGLTETAQPDSSCSGFSYTSGAIQTQNTFGYGKVIVTAKFAGGTGPWPAIWMLGQNCQPWKGPNHCNWPNPGGQEIDIAEVLGSSHSSIHQGIHSSTGDHSCDPPVSDNRNLHTYELDWAANSVTWKIDNKTTCSKSEALSQPMFLIINTAVGGTGGASPQDGTQPWVTTVTSASIP